MLECRACGCCTASTWYNVDGDVYCGDCCTEIDAVKCGVCENDFDTDACREIYVRDLGMCYVCDECRDELYYCERCGDYVVSDSWDYDHDCCTDCCDNPFESVCDYHIRPNLRPLGGSWGDKLIGLEIEIDSNNTNYSQQSIVDTVNNVVPNKSVWFNTDSSLSYHGIEIITQPMTVEYLTNEMRLDKVFEALLKRGYNAYDNGRCGLHIHFNSSWYDWQSVARLVNFVQSNSLDFVRLSKRDDMTYCNVFNWVYDTEEDTNNFINSDCYDNHHYWINTDPDTETLEIRLMRGTLNHDSFIKSVRLWCYLLDKAKDVSWIESSAPSVWLCDMPSDLLEWINERGAFRNSWVSIVNRYEKGVKQICA